MRREKLSAGYRPLLDEYGLGGLDPERLSLLRFHRGEFLYRDGEEMKYLMLVVNGRAKVCRASQNGKSLLLAFYSGAGLLGDVELMLDLPVATSDVQAISDFSAIGVPYPIAEGLKRNPAFVLRIAQGLASHVERNTQNSVATVLNPLEARLCSYIAEMSLNDFFRERLTVLSELLGTSYRHLLRTLDSLCRKGVLKKESGGYRVLDEGTLHGLGGDMYSFRTAGLPHSPNNGVER